MYMITLISGRQVPVARILRVGPSSAAFLAHTALGKGSGYRPYKISTQILMKLMEKSGRCQENWLQYPSQNLPLYWAGMFHLPAM